MTRKLTLRREAEISLDELAGITAGTYSGNPFCVISITAPCVTSLCTEVDCLYRKLTTAVGPTS